MPPADLLLVVAVLIPTAALRLWQLDAVGFRGDEAVYAGQAAVLAGEDGMDRWFILSSRGNSNFLIFQGIVSVVYRLFGVDDLSARLVSAIFSILTVPVVYAIGRLLYGRSAGLFAALLLGLSSYAVVLGRLALLDPTFTFFGTVAVFCVLMFCRSDRAVWMYGMVASTALTMQVKVVGVLLIPIALLFAAAEGTWPRFTLRRLVTAALVGMVVLTPTWVQLATISPVSDFMSASTRSSGVPWYYYYEQLFSYEGAAVIALYVAGLARAAVRFERNYLIPVLWLVVILAFLQVYPLKGFNYLLPVMPALALLAGRAAGEAWDWVLGWSAARHRMLRRIAEGLSAGYIAAVVIVASVAPHVAAALGEDSSAGLREAARWLSQHGEPGAGVMTISHGSAQHVLSFYGGLDAYPFGRFRLATVMPGGEIIPARTGSAPDGGPPRDWVNYWPPRLINDGTVSYLVYYTGHLDDPPTQQQLSGTMSRQQFQGLIERYGGELLHTIFWDHEARVHIYQVTKRLPYPVVDVTADDEQLTVTGEGFTITSPVTVAYHGKVIARGKTDPQGKVAVTTPLPDGRRASYHLVVTDAEGHDASAVGVPGAQVRYTLADGRVMLHGSGYAPGSTVTVSYAGQPLDTVVAGELGQFSLDFPQPTEPKPDAEVEARDEHGHTASVAGPPAAPIPEPPAERADPPAKAAGPPAPVPEPYVVRPGDSLWSIAESEYGSGYQWPLIWTRNEDSLTDPNVIHPGITLQLPPRPPEAAADDDSAAPGASP